MKLDKDSCNYLDVTRCIGIYLVIFSHFMFPFQYLAILGFVFSFHMPLFFMISGILHKIQPFSWKGVLQLALALVVPYLIYNVLGVAYLLATGSSVASLLLKIHSSLLGEPPITGASWFLLAMFWVKFFALFLQNRKSLIVFGLGCMAFIFITDFFEFRFAYDNIFRLRASLLSFPFFVIGYLLKDVVSIDLSAYKKGLLVVAFLAINFFFFFFFGSLNIISLMYPNLLVMLAMATAGSLALIYFSQLIVPWVSFGFVKDISRGTMMIVGIHVFLMFDVFPSVFFGVMPLRYIIVLSALMLLGFYIIIRLTYNRIPILYGKWRG